MREIGARAARPTGYADVVNFAPPSMASSSAVEGALMLLFNFRSIVKHKSFVALSLTDI